jgi:hypothetical protein
MVVARAADGWTLRRKQRTNTFPFGVGEFLARRRRGKARDVKCGSYSGAARDVAPLSHGLMRSAPARPAEVESPLCVVRDSRKDKAADLRNTRRDQRRTVASSPF